jgi:hypothetical protein
LDAGAAKRWVRMTLDGYAYTDARGEKQMKCYRCGACLGEISLPFSRLEECPSCENYLHVCRMCVFFDPAVPKQCREDDAEEVQEKERANFCEWFKPDADAYDPSYSSSESKARDELAALFGDAEPSEKSHDGISDADKLFK